MDPAEAILSCLILPLWLAAGRADWVCHRSSDIAHTTGPKESLLHLLMFAEVVVPLLSCLFLEINALVIATMVAGFLAREVTALWDVSYATAHRAVTPIEQHIHSFLELMPLMALLLMAMLGASVLLDILPYLEELVRGIRARRQDGDGVAE